MRLKAAINGQIYDIVEGATFAEEHSETLDSGTIIIDKVSKFDLRPYDDVFIFDADEDRYVGWGLHFQGTISKDLQEGAEFRYRNQTIVIGQDPGIPPTPIIQFVTAIDLYDPSISSLVGRMTGEWHARISCDVFWVEQQGGYPLPSSGRMSSLYRVPQPKRNVRGLEQQGCHWLHASSGRRASSPVDGGRSFWTDASQLACGLLLR